MRGRARDVDSFAASIEARLRAMTRVHRALAGSGWRSVKLGELVGGVLRGMGQMAQCQAAERVAGPDVSVPPKLALPLTLILAEWHTNSCKYGAHSTPGGQVHVTWEVADGDDGGHRIWLTWREQGGPPVRQPVIGSVGSDLVHAFATRELGGGCTMTFPPSGAHHAIEFVVPR
jgi:two-component sensor histidine kinase